MFDQMGLDRPGNDEIQLALFTDYQTNIDQYPQWHEALRRVQPPVLCVWGKNDPIFIPAGAEAFRRDVPKAEIQFIDTGHFALEEDLHTIAANVLTEGNLAIPGEVHGRRAARPSYRQSFGIGGSRVVLVLNKQGRVVTARSHAALLGHHATTAADGTPLVDGRPWTDPSVLADVRKIAGPGAELVPDQTADSSTSCRCWWPPTARLPSLAATAGGSGRTS